MEMKRQQAIFWTNVDLIHWRIYAAPGGDELTHCGLVMPYDDIDVDQL